MCVCFTFCLYNVSEIVSCGWFDCSQVEENNDLHINVFGVEEKKVYPLRLATTPQVAVNLLLVHNDELKLSHWVWIKYFSRLCAHRTQHHGHTHYCMRCLSAHNTAAALDNHIRYCSTHAAAAVEMAEEGEKLTFANYHKMLKCPYVSLFFFL